MQHSNAKILEQIYLDLSKGNIQSVLNTCADQITFQVPGKAVLAGKYSKMNFHKDFFSKLMELTNGTFKTEIHDILASDRHAVVLATDYLIRGGQPFEYRTVHVWRFEGEKPVAWYQYPRDLYQYDVVWA